MSIELKPRYLADQKYIVLGAVTLLSFLQAELDIVLHYVYYGWFSLDLNAAVPRGSCVST